LVIFLFFALDSGSTVFTIVLLDVIKFLFRLFGEVCGALRMNPSSVRAFFVAVTLDKQLTVDSAFANTILDVVLH
jgi:hypothetical protein